MTKGRGKHQKAKRLLAKTAKVISRFDKGGASAYYGGDLRVDASEKYGSMRAPFKGKIMARPIKETPVLRGEDARRFTERISNPPKVSLEEVRRAQAIYRAVNKHSGLPCCG
jgi:hypothetical protein